MLNFIIRFQINIFFLLNANPIFYPLKFSQLENTVATSGAGKVRPKMTVREMHEHTKR